MVDLYAEIPYPAAPIPLAHPGRLAVLGRLHGLATPEPHRARILELGCATGANLTPVAFYAPATHCLGIDVSAAQIEAAKRLADDMELCNVSFRRCDLAEPPDDLGEFDYIIAHGLYSWVPPPVREAILSICGRWLSPAGVAYISFNTTPGWHLRGVLRQLLLFHVRGITSPQERLASAQDLMGRFEQALADSDNPGLRQFRELIANVRARAPGYWYHEYMETVNDAVPFADFAEAAARHGLQYVCDALPFSVQTAKIAEPARVWLDALGDLVEQEQLLDFLELRPFRRALLCRQGLRLDRDPSVPFLETLAASADVAASGKVDLRSARPVPFVRFDGRKLHVSHPLTKAALTFLGEVYPSAIVIGELVRRAKAAALVGGAQRLADQALQLQVELLGLFRTGTLDLHLDARSYPATTPSRPRLNRLSRAQLAADFDHLTGCRHRIVPLDAFSQRLATYLDGSRTHGEVVDALAADIAAGTLCAPASEGERSAKIEKTLNRHYAGVVALFVRHGLFDPE